MHAQGPQRHKEATGAFMTAAATVSALFLSATVPLMLDPPDIVTEDTDVLKEEGLEWVPWIYNFGLAVSLGSSLTVTMAGISSQMLHLSCIRDADWLRMQYNRGDFVAFWQQLFFPLSVFALFPPGAAIWYSTGISAESGWGYLTLFFILWPLIQNSALMVMFMLNQGDLAVYWLKTGAAKNDPPDFDFLIESFEAKVAFAQKFVELDTALHNSRVDGTQQQSLADSGNAMTGSIVMSGASPHVIMPMPMPIAAPFM